MTKREFNRYQALAAFSEETKYEGFKRANQGETPEERRDDMKLAIRGYYIREKQWANETGGAIPSFRTYLIHFISAKRNYYKDEPLVHEAVQNLIAQYGFVDNPKIAEGGKSWKEDR